MPVHLNFHLWVDRNGKATVTTQTISGGPVPTTKLQPGDKVTFTSNDEFAEIRFKLFGSDPPPKTKKGSAFPNQLPEGQRHRVVTGREFTVETACDFDNHFVVECGHDVNGDFSEWGAPTGRPRGMNMPGPTEP
jgi:hypothetical protein